jgi:hypothetical protein
MHRTLVGRAALVALLGIVACHYELGPTLAKGELHGRAVIVGDDGGLIVAPGTRVSIVGSAAGTVSDDNGYFALKGLPAGTFDVRFGYDDDGDGIADAGRVLRGVALDEAAGFARELGDVPVALLGGITGVVMRKGEPVGGVRVVIAGEGERRSSDDGRFTLGNLFPGRGYRVTAFSTSGDALVAISREVEVRSAKASGVTLELGAADATGGATGSLQGVVRTIDGAGVGDVAFTLFPAQDGVTLPSPGADGRFEIAGLPVGAYLLTATKAGYVAAHAPFLAVAGSTVVPDLLLARADRSCGLGETRDTDGDGLGDACDVDANGDGLVDDVLVSGGGCSSAGEVSGLFALAALARGLRRRRRTA